MLFRSRETLDMSSTCLCVLLSGDDEAWLRGEGMEDGLRLKMEEKFAAN